MLYAFSIIAYLATLVSAWLPESKPSDVSLSAFNNTKMIRGVNAGSQCIVEPWMVGDVWTDTLQCDGTDLERRSERGCIQESWNGDVDGASVAWTSHWDTWITHDDIQLMVSYGLNTIRIPVGFWMMEDIVSEYELFPKGGIEHLQQFCGWATEAGMYIIIDLHALPGRQAQDAFTGDKTNDTLGFYESDEESGRAYEFLEWMIERIYENESMRNVGAIEIINEPIRETMSTRTDWMVKQYYTSAVDRIRAKEQALGVADDQKLHIVVMDDLWLSGPPAEEYVHDSQLLFDDHNYQNFNDFGNEEAILHDTCASTRSGNGEDPKFVGEWTMKLLDSDSVPDNGFNSKYFRAQQVQYEKTRGWVFWSWRVEGPADALLWSYKDAVREGIIDRDLNAMLDGNPC